MEEIKVSEKSCGTVPFTVIDGKIYYLLIKTKVCTLPKGHVEAGESEKETALRETWEETSLRVNIIDGFRREIEYPLSKYRRKAVVFFLGQYEGDTPRENPGFEKFTYLSLPYHKALRALTFENTRSVLRAANDFLVKKGIAQKEEKEKNYD